MHRPRKKRRGAPPPAAPEQAWRQNHARAGSRGQPPRIAPLVTPPHLGTATPGSWLLVQRGRPGRCPPRSREAGVSAGMRTVRGVPPRHCAARRDRPPCQRRFSRQAARLNPTRTAPRSPATPPRAACRRDRQRKYQALHTANRRRSPGGAMQARPQSIYCQNAGTRGMAEDPPKGRRRPRLGDYVEKAATESDASG